MAFLPPAFAGLSVSILIYIIVHTLRMIKDGKKKLPPGPKGLPFLGNINELPKPGVFEAHHWLKHKDIYGPISSVTVMGQSIIILNDLRIADELLDKRSSKHSTRPRQVFAGEMIGWANITGFVPYGEQFRLHRKYMSRVIGSKAAAARFNHVQEEETGHFLLHLLEDPENLVSHIKKEAGSIILKIAYGYTTESHKDDYLVNLGVDAMDKFGRAAVPGAFMVDMFPFLRHIPEWMPGTTFKKTAREWKVPLAEAGEKPYSFVKHKMNQGKSHRSYLSELLETGNADLEQIHAKKWSTLSLYLGGSDTTVSSIWSFFLAMMINPEVQKKAQDEIDRVIGTGRLPTMDDRSNLPYVGAIVQELHRWNPVAPMCLPHASSEVDNYNGYHIPKNSLLLPNIWAFTHDPEVYFEPSAFRPERYIKTPDHEPEPEPNQFIFGFGRRICPGRILAENSIYLNVAQTLAVFDIAKPIEDGHVIEPKIEYEPGVISHPKPFKVSIQPRSPNSRQLLESVLEKYPWRESDSKVLKEISI